MMPFPIPSECETYLSRTRYFYGTHSKISFQIPWNVWRFCPKPDIFRISSKDTLSDSIGMWGVFVGSFYGMYSNTKWPTLNCSLISIFHLECFSYAQIFKRLARDRYELVLKKIRLYWRRKQWLHQACSKKKKAWVNKCKMKTSLLPILKL